MGANGRNMTSRKLVYSSQFAIGLQFEKEVISQFTVHNSLFAGISMVFLAGKNEIRTVNCKLTSFSSSQFKVNFFNITCNCNSCTRAYATINCKLRTVN